MEVIQEFLSNLAVISVPVIMFFVSYGLNILKAYIQSKTQNDALDKYIDSIVEAVRDSVYITAQDYTSDLKKEQGKLTLEQQAEALKKAKDKFIELMGEEAKEIIEQVYGEFDDWFKLKVDAVLGSSKL